MMLNPKISKLLNDQIKKEFHSAYLYLDIANYYYDNSLNGFANWFDVQTQEEHAHAMFFVNYLRDNGEKITLQSIPEPEYKFKDFKEPLLAALEHEHFITNSINELYSEAYAAKDYRTMKFLDWFVKEQGEEEKNTEDICKRFDLFGGDAKGLYMLDNELGTRIFVPPVLP
jgi:ferritin